MLRNPVMFVAHAWSGQVRSQTAALPQTRKTTLAKVLWEPRRGATWTPIASTDLGKGDVVLVEAGDVVPGDGEVIEGAARVDETAVTGERAPVLRKSGVSVRGGGRVLSDWIVVRITASPGDLDD